MPLVCNIVSNNEHAYVEYNALLQKTLLEALRFCSATYDHL